MNNANSELESTIEEVRSELRSILIRRKELIEKLGLAFEKVIANKGSICEEIKNCLKDEISSNIISTRTIEQCCRPEWKRKTKPSKLENENFSFSGRSEEEEQRQRKIILDNSGNPVQDIGENNYSYPNPERATTNQESDLIQRLNRTIRELIYEIKKVRQEKDEIQVKLREAIESLQLQKLRESEQYQNVFDTEFPVDYRLLQRYMAQIYKSTERQQVWLTIKIDANNKKVVSVQIGKKLLPQNVGV